MFISTDIRSLILLYLSGVDFSNQISDLKLCIKEVYNNFKKFGGGRSDNIAFPVNYSEKIKEEIFDLYIEGFLDFRRENSVLVVKISEKGKMSLRDNDFFRFVFENFP